MYKPTFIHAFQNVLTTLLNLLILFLLTRNSNTEEFGIYVVSKSLILLIDYSHLGARYGLDVELVNNKSMENQWIGTTKSTGIIVGALISIILVVFYKNPIYIIFILSGYLYSIISTHRLSYRAIGEDRKSVV